MTLASNIRRFYGARQKSERALSLVEVMVAVMILGVLGLLALSANVNSRELGQKNIDRDDVSILVGNTYELFKNDVKAANHFITSPGSDTLELYNWDYSVVRYRFVMADDGTNVLTREEAEVHPAHGGVFSGPAEKARGFPDSHFDVDESAVVMVLGEELISEEPAGLTYTPGPEKTQEQANAELMLRQDIALARSKEHSTESFLVLELTDGSWVRWEVRGSRLLRSTAATAYAPAFGDERVLMENASGATFTYDFYATRDITFNVNDESVTFQMPLLAP